MKNNLLRPAIPKNHGTGNAAPTVCSRNPIAFGEINYIFSMNKKEHIDYWLISAQHDIKVMDNLFAAANYD
jgi:hypothetical protein